MERLCLKHEKPSFRESYTPEARFPRRGPLRLSEKSLGGLWSVGCGSATLQEQAFCAPFQQFVSSSVREFESFQTVSKKLSEKVSEGSAK